MKKFLKTLTTIGTTALAVVGGIYVYRKFFAKDEELDEAFDDDEVFEDADEDEEEVKAFDSEEEIFEDEDAPVSAAPEAAEEGTAADTADTEEPATVNTADSEEPSAADTTVEEQEHA